MPTTFSFLTCSPTHCLAASVSLNFSYANNRFQLNDVFEMDDFFVVSEIVLQFCASTNRITEFWTSLIARWFLVKYVFFFCFRNSACILNETLINTSLEIITYSSHSTMATSYSPNQRHYNVVYYIHWFTVNKLYLYHLFCSHSLPVKISSVCFSLPLFAIIGL